MTKQQQRLSMTYERKTSLSLMPAFNDSALPPTSTVEMSEEVASIRFPPKNMSKYPICGHVANACIDTSIHPQTKVSRRRSLGISMHDLCELTGDSIFESFGDASTHKHSDETFDPFISVPKDIHTNNSNTNTWTSSELAPQCRAMRRTSLSFVPLCNDTTQGYFDKKDFDAALDSSFHEASEIQPCGPVSGMASDLHSTFDPSNPLYSLDFVKDYQGCLKELVGQMETSKKSRSKVAMVKMLLMRHEKKQLLPRKLVATGLNTTKSEETRKLFLQAHYYLANKASAAGPGTGTGALMNVTSSSCNAKPISCAAIKDTRRKNARSGDSIRYERPAPRHVSMDITVNFDDAILSAPSSSGTNMKMHMNANGNSKKSSVAYIDTSIHSQTKVSRRRSLDIFMHDLCELTGDSIFGRVKLC